MKMASKLRLEWLSFLQGLLFAAFIYTQTTQLQINASIKQIPGAVEPQQLVLLSFGERPLLARSISLWLQSYDSQLGKIVQFESFDYDRLIAWFNGIEFLDPLSQYPLLTASRIFIESRKPEQVRKMITFVHQQFLKDPDKRWRWQLDVVMVAKHRLKDLALAQLLARDLRLKTKDSDIPHWIRDIEHLILAEQGELEAAIMVIDSLLNEGLIKDANELRFLTSKLKELSDKLEHRP